MTSGHFKLLSIKHGQYLHFLSECGDISLIISLLTVWNGERARTAGIIRIYLNATQDFSIDTFQMFYSNYLHNLIAYANKNTV